MEYSFFEELLKSFNKFNCDPPPGTADDECRNSDSDIPGGFQDLSPQLFTLLGEILGNVVAGKMPFNVQNSVGNWLELVGQAILTINAQEQYFYSGPGRYYNPIYRNSTNSFCSQENSTTSNNTSTSNLEDKVKKLEKEIEKLKVEIKDLKNKS